MGMQAVLIHNIFFSFFKKKQYGVNILLLTYILKENLTGPTASILGIFILKNIHIVAQMTKCQIINLIVINCANEIFVFLFNLEEDL